MARASSNQKLEVPDCLGVPVRPVLYVLALAVPDVPASTKGAVSGRLERPSRQALPAVYYLASVPGTISHCVVEQKETYQDHCQSTGNDVGRPATSRHRSMGCKSAVDPTFRYERDQNIAARFSVRGHVTA